MASQTGSIDLTASNSVKLAAEAGWQSDLDGYYTKSEIDVTVGGINSTVSTKVGEDEVISSINQSSESVSINADKINLTGEVTISDLSSDAQSATLNSNISVGGRNLLKNSAASSDNLKVVGGNNATFVSEDGYDCYKATGGSTIGYFYGSQPSASTVRPYLEANMTYIYSAWIKVETTASGVTSVSHHFTSLGHHQVYNANSTASDKAHEDIVAKRVYTPSTVNIGEWTYITEQFTTNSLDGSILGKYVKVALGSDYTVYVRDMKLERGNKATDWTPAPEDVDSAISDAAKTATNYVTDINNNGITVHPKRSDYATNGGRAVINADGLTVYVGSDDVASYGASARIGKANSDRVTVDSTNGITIYKGNSKRLQTTANGIDVYGSDGTTSVASFGSVARIGALSGTNVLISGDRFSMTASDGNEALRIVTDTTTIPASDSSTGQTQTAYGVILTDENRLSYMDMSPSTDVDQYGKLYFTDHLSLSLNFSDIFLGGGITYIDDGLQVDGGTIISGGVTVDGTFQCDGANIYGTTTTSDNVECGGRLKAHQRIEADNSYGSVALEMADSGNRGIWDVDNSQWIVCKTYDDDLIINGLGSNFDIDAAVALSGSTSISANGVQTGTTNITKANGWVPVAIAGVNVNSHWAATVRWYLSARDSGTGTISWAVHNMSGTAAITPTVTFYVLWVRA